MHIQLRVRIFITLIILKINFYRLFAGVIPIIAVIILSLNTYHLPNTSDGTKDHFSASNVQEDIKIIAKEPHSIEHPLERDVVRDYLYKRLKSFGDSVDYYFYDSLPFSNKGFIDIGNLFAVYEPEGKTPDSYVLLMAHMDSRFANNVKGKTVYSYGAADDGYGIGVILELLRVVQTFQDQWKNGVKILFTDSEEYGLYGISKAFNEDYQIFENVSLILNFEARGVKGPAILFETSPGNNNIIELYKKARIPVAYSLTSAVYNLLPNYTDFTVVKDNLPGMNFSVIDDLNFYHTDKDNFDNISTRSIQHYGEQVQPMLKEFLLNENYSNPAIFKSKANKVYFTMPAVGLIQLPETTYLIVISFLLAIFILFTLFYIIQSKVRIVNIFKMILHNLFLVLFTSSLAFLFAKLLAQWNGLEYQVVNLAYVEYEYFHIAIFLVLSSLLYISILLSKTRKGVKLMEMEASAIILLFTIAIAMHIFMGDSVLFFVPLAFGIVSYCMKLFTSNPFFPIVSIIFILLFAITLFYLLAVALTIGSLFIINALILLYLSVLTPLSLFYLKPTD